MNRAECLDGARQVVLRDRNLSYGEPEELFEDIAARWSLTLATTVTPAQVALCMIDLKVARAAANPTHADNWLDIAGYAACGAEISTPETP